MGFIVATINKDCADWARSCIPCQRAKASRHVTTPPKNLELPRTHFEYIHMNIVGALPISRGFRELIPLTGATYFVATVYYPEVNGMVERLHRQIMVAIKYHQAVAWVEVMPIVLLAQLVYGKNSRLPGELVETKATTSSTSSFAIRLRHQMQQLRPILGTWHGSRNTFTRNDLHTKQQLFLRHNGTRYPLQVLPAPVQNSTREARTTHELVSPINRSHRFSDRYHRSD
ncbi:uncharacterized protein LOC143431365 [Xylocopa sonorina]|uniref:uncharacterized protein LOC143431365 n=1 Tax=Xylocopa sonorina TaxID=1818115 RepID=UPI00403AD7FD